MFQSARFGRKVLSLRREEERRGNKTLTFANESMISGARYQRVATSDIVSCFKKAQNRRISKTTPSNNEGVQLEDEEEREGKREREKEIKKNSHSVMNPAPPLSSSPPGAKPRANPKSQI